MREYHVAFCAYVKIPSQDCNDGDCTCHSHDKSEPVSLEVVARVAIINGRDVLTIGIVQGKDSLAKCLFLGDEQLDLQRYGASFENEMVAIMTGAKDENKK